jgi:hypothetical protein
MAASSAAPASRPPPAIRTRSPSSPPSAWTPRSPCWCSTRPPALSPTPSASPTSRRPARRRCGSTARIIWRHRAPDCRHQCRRQQPHRHVSGVFDDAAGDSAGAERHERAAAGGRRRHQRRVVRCHRRLARRDRGDLGQSLGPAARSLPAARFQRPAHHFLGGTQVFFNGNPRP